MKSNRVSPAIFGAAMAGSAISRLALAAEGASASMRRTSEKLKAALGNAAIDIAFTGGQRPDRTRRSKRQQIDFGDPAGKQHPFSLTRQDRRTARSQVSVLGNNGHVTLQTLPSRLRRSEVEVDMVLRGELKTGLVDQRVNAVLV